MTMTKTTAIASPRKPDGRDAVRLWLRLLACSNLVEGHVRGRLRQTFATTLPRFDMLAQLDAAARAGEASITLSELSRRLMVSNGNLTGLTGRLVRERLVSRSVSAEDRRAQRLRLTAAGKTALDAMAEKHRRWIEAMFAGISRRESLELYRLIGKLKGSVQANAGEEPR